MDSITIDIFLTARKMLSYSCSTKFGTLELGESGKASANTDMIASKLLIGCIQTLEYTERWVLQLVSLSHERWQHFVRKELASGPQNYKTELKINIYTIMASFPIGLLMVPASLVATVLTCGVMPPGQGSE
ncbi:hypothetical protein KIN20_034269 [Parelaphostrongylus tenuis]|uniref:Uncharacterized protein n=1 Tax=Parelaphostrongylus tenuis TaxID=148309 RepID=A0AAD5R9H0_PARTN|nr:hypothetical protein KIN20_034269 [Parelaphostrongylus tenuis]